MTRVFTYVWIALIFILLNSSCYAVSLDMEGLGQIFVPHQQKYKHKGWNDKDGTAAHYKISDHNYRTYQATTSSTPDGGLLVTVKIDHDRKWEPDDYAILTLNYDAQGNLVSAKVDTEIKGEANISSGLITAAGMSGNKYAIAAAIAAKLAESIYNKLSKAFETGGRKIFLQVIQHNVNWITANVK